LFAGSFILVDETVERHSGQPLAVASMDTVSNTTVATVAPGGATVTVTVSTASVSRG
jgi:hypothetical protein